MKYLIEKDSPSKTFKFRIINMSGNTVGYFVHMNDALAWCRVN
jgi:hypothetical protein